MCYICPICHSELMSEHNRYCCAAGHSFDCAKEGYINLLPVNKKKSKDPGDNKAMMFARREFLNAGYYQHLSQRINELAQQWQLKINTALDLGCGEGYYTQQLYESIKKTNAEVNMQGLDISRSAVRYAAKRYPEINFCVASAYDMPFADEVFDFILRVYAPSKPEELARVMADKGILMTVSPGPSHHYAIKQIIYAEPRLHELKNQHLLGFEKLHQERLVSTLVLEGGKMIEHFLEMTPYAWKLTSSQKQKLVQEGLSCELDFLIEIHQKR